MANQQIFNAYLGTGNRYNLRLVFDWETPATGSTVASVRVRTYFISLYSVSDSVNSFSTTVKGTTNTKSNSVINHGSSGGTTLIYDKTYTITVSTTVSTSVPGASTLDNVDAIGLPITVSGTITIPATGSAASHPTIAAGTYNFTKNGLNVPAAFSIIKSGGAGYSVSEIVVKAYTDRTGNTASSHIWSKTGSVGNTLTETLVGNTYNLQVAASTLDNSSGLLKYWETQNEVTRIGITVTTLHSTTDTKVHPEVFITPNDFAGLYNTSSFSVVRGATYDTTKTKDQVLTAVVSASSLSPWRQFDVWPANILTKFYFDTVSAPNEIGNGTQGTGSSQRTITITDTTVPGHAVLKTASQEYNVVLYVNSSPVENIDLDTYTLQPMDSFICLDKNGASPILGINTGSPTKTLDVNGQIACKEIFPSEFSHVFYYKNTLMSIPTSSFTTVLYDTKGYDILSEYNTETGIFTPLKTGYYSISAALVSGEYAFDDNEVFMLAISKNNSTSLTDGTLLAGMYDQGIDITPTVSKKSTVSSIVYLLGDDDGTPDTARIKVYQSVGGTIDTIANNALHCWLSIHRIA